MQENDRYFFSIYGYLDASADTNWIRVMPIREEFLMEPEPIDATVTIEDLAGETTTVMNDSLFYYGDNAYAWNFWTALPLEPGATYRITAERSDGRSSLADVQLPDDFPTPLVYDSPRASVAYDQIYIEGVENLADVRSFHLTQSLESPGDPEIIFTFSHLQDTSHASPPYDYLINIDDSEIYSAIDDYYDSWTPPGITTRYAILQQQLFIAAAGPDWHHFPSLDENIIALPDEISNVENGVGYVAGIVSKTVPYQTCYDEGERWVPCPLEKPIMHP